MADGKKTRRIVTEQQERLILSIPGVDQVVAQQKMLRHFGCGEKVLTATAEELTEVALVGAEDCGKVARGGGRSGQGVMVGGFLFTDCKQIVCGL